MLPQQRPPSFFEKIYNNFWEEMERNRKLKQSIKEFQKDMKVIEQSETLQKARFVTCKL